MHTRRQMIQTAVAAALAGCARKASAWWPMGGSGSGSSPSTDPIDGYYSAGTFTSDPFAAYSSTICDTTFMGTAGAPTTVSWNGSTITAPTYSTLQAAITAATGAGNRVCLLAGETYPVSATNITFPGGGSGNSTRFVLQGDPAATSSTMPIIDFGNNGGTIIPCYSNDTKWLTFRKLKFQNNFASCIAFSPNAQQAIDGVIIEFCYFYNLVAPSGATDNGFINHGPGVTWAMSALPSYRYCYFNYATVTGYDPATQRENTGGITFVCSGTAGAYGAYIHHNEFYECGQGIYNKVAPYNSTASPNGIIYAYNWIHDCAIGIYNGGAGASENPYIGDRVFNNLFTAGISGYNQDSSGMSTPQCSDSRIWNNTFGTDCENAVGFAETEDIQFFNNLVLATNGSGFTLTTSDYTNSVALCDYNAYYVPGSVVMFQTNRLGTPNYTYDAVTGSGGWDSAYTTNAPVQLSVNPDTNSFNAVQGRDVTTADVNDAAADDYSPIVGSALLTSGQNGGYIGCYNSDSIASSNLVGRGWA